MRIKKILEKIIQRLNLNKYVKIEPTNLDLVEYDLLDFNEDLEEAWIKINKLYNEILYKDEHWHLFYEGNFSTLRFSPEYINKVGEFFGKHKIKSKYNGKWIDGSPIVEKYKNMYRNIFHEFSVMAICLEEKDLYVAADRVCHSFFNHHHYMAKEYRKPFEGEKPLLIDPIMWEVEMMSRLSLYRSHLIGRYSIERYYKTMTEKNNKDKSNDIADE